MGIGWGRSLKLQRRNNEVVGLDIGSSTVKIVQLRKDRSGYTVTAAGMVDIAASGANNDRREINTIRAISKCLEMTGIQTRLAVCGVCGPEVAVRSFNFPSLLPEEMQGAILLEASQVCPFNVDNGDIDYQLTSEGNNNTSGFLVAATNKLIKRKSQLTKNASLHCVLMDVDGLALLNCFREYKRKEAHVRNYKEVNNNMLQRERISNGAGRTTAILNVGSSYTNLAIVSDKGLPFVRDMAYAGEAIVDRIASENDVSTGTVIRILSGWKDPSGAQLELGDSLERACQKLIVDVTETVRYYMAQEKSAVVDRVLVCGGFALVNGFVELLDSRLPAKTVLWNPFDKMRCRADRHRRDILRRYTAKQLQDILQKNGPAMAVAAGLAMRSI